jgi:hypothetical protein
VLVKELLLKPQASAGRSGCVKTTKVGRATYLTQ